MIGKRRLQIRASGEGEVFDLCLNKLEAMLRDHRIFLIQIPIVLLCAFAFCGSAGKTLASTYLTKHNFLCFENMIFPDEEVTICTSDTSFEEYSGNYVCDSLLSTNSTKFRCGFSYHKRGEKEEYLPKNCQWNKLAISNGNKRTNCKEYFKYCQYQVSISKNILILEEYVYSKKEECSGGWKGLDSEQTEYLRLEGEIGDDGVVNLSGQRKVEKRPQRGVDDRAIDETCQAELLENNRIRLRFKNTEIIVIKQE